MGEELGQANKEYRGIGPSIAIDARGNLERIVFAE